MIPFRANAYGSLRSGNVVIAQTGINAKVTDFSTIEVTSLLFLYLYTEISLG